MDARSATGVDEDEGAGETAGPLKMLLGGDAAVGDAWTGLARDEDRAGSIWCPAGVYGRYAGPAWEADGPGSSRVGRGGRARSEAIGVGATRGDVSRGAVSGVLAGVGLRTLDVVERPDAVRVCVDWGRRGDDGTLGREEAGRRGIRLNVDPLREDDSDVRAGRGLAVGEDSLDCAGETADGAVDGPATGVILNLSGTASSCLTVGSAVITGGGTAEGGREGDVDSGVLRSELEGEPVVDDAASSGGELTGTITDVWGGTAVGGGGLLRWASYVGMTSVIETVRLLSSNTRPTRRPSAPLTSFPLSSFSEAMEKSRCRGTTGSLKLCPCAKPLPLTCEYTLAGRAACDAVPLSAVWFCA